jgi:hypothetical protein
MAERRNLKLFLVGLMLAMSVGEPLLADRYVSCIQEQLTEAGLEPGPVDGELGKRTVAATQELSKIHQSIAAMVPLKKTNAAAYCRAIGLARNSTAGWSDSGNLIELQFGTQISPYSAVRVGRIAKEVETYYTDKLKIVLPQSVLFIASASVDEAAKLASVELKERGEYHQIIDSFTSWCGGYGYCGKSYGGVVAITFSEAGSLPERDIKNLLAHELAHEIQAQYVGNFRATGEQNIVRSRGPKWLTEAATLELGLNFVQPDAKPPSRVYRHQSSGEFSSDRLRQFKLQSASLEDGFLEHSTYAGALLAHLSSPSAFIDFWEKTPILGWERAFEAAFGLTVEAFFVEYDAK